jgi:YVTN family beta-propeller protein
MKKILLPVFSVLLIIFISCSDESGKSTVRINLINTSSARLNENRSILEKIFSFIIYDAYAQVPPSVASIAVRVAGPGMTPIKKTYSSYTSTIILEVPSGPNRIFIIEGRNSSNEILYIGTSDPVDLSPGEDENLSITMSSRYGKIYVANSGSNNVSVIDGAENTVKTTITTGTSPYAVAVNQITKTIYISNIDSNNVTVINGNTDSPITSISIDSPLANYDTGGIAINLLTNKIYVSKEYDDLVSAINGATNTLITDAGAVYPIPIGDNYPSDIKANTLTNKIYVAVWGGSSVYVINGATDVATAITDTGSLIDNNYGIAINQNTNRIYTTNNYGDSISVIDGESDTVLENITVGDSPIGIDVNPVTNRIYVANSSASSITVIDGNTNSSITTITANIGNTPTGVAVNSKTNRIYVSNSASGTVSVINGLTNTVITTITVGTAPAYLCVLQ